MGSTGKKRQSAQQGTENKRTSAAKSSREGAHAASHAASHATEPVQPKRTGKRRKMNWKEWVGVCAAIVAALVLCTVMVINMRLFPYTETAADGTQYVTHISLVQKIRNKTPFVDLNGELNSKEYSFDVKSQVVNVSTPEESSFNDGLDLKQIQEGQFSVLFLGLDALRANTDVMMLAVFDIAGNKVNILQIPRDTFVPEHTAFEGKKINSVYELGDSSVSQVQRVVDCVEDLFHIPIDRYIITSCTDIVDIVDLIGGIPIDMPYTINYEPGKTITAGKQTLNGQKAEWMVRYRHGYAEGDIGRMKAQRIFLAAAMAKACDIGTFKLIGYAKTMVDRQLIGSNLSIDEISKLSDFATTIGMDNISMFMLPGEGANYYPTNWKYYDHYSVWSVHYQPAMDLLNKYFRPYYEPIQSLPIEELVKAGSYKSTVYDNESIDFESIENGEGFAGH